MIFLVCSGAGFYYAFLQKQTYRQLAQLQRCLDLMVCHLEYQGLSLPQLCSLMRGETTGGLQDFWKNLEQELSQQILPEAADCSRAALESCQQLQGPVRQRLLELGGILGKFDLDGQIHSLQAMQEDCRRQVIAVENNLEVRLRSYRTIGLCLGIGLVLLLL